MALRSECSAEWLRANGLTPSTLPKNLLGETTA